jgi:protoheme IX farnesyltransferase
MAITETLSYSRVTTVGDFFALLKPRVMSLVVFTGLAGIVAAPGHVHPLTAFTALLCIALAAGASGALNMAYDSDIDGVMARTASRPIPMGHIAREDAMAFGWSIAAFSVATMWLFVNWLAASLLAFTVFFYVVVYTLWLKRRTPQNIVIGGLAGALPPAIGWASVTGNLALAPLVLVAIIFMWTPPHFWALALWRCDDYAKAGVPMLPVVKGKTVTRRHILIYSLILAPLGVAPAFIGLGGMLYLVSSASMGFWMLLEAFATWREKDEMKEPAAKRLFGVSLLYVFVPFAALIVERLLHLPPLWT